MLAHLSRSILVTSDGRLTLLVCKTPLLSTTSAFLVMQLKKHFSSCDGSVGWPPPPELGEWVTDSTSIPTSLAHSSLYGERSPKNGSLEWT